MWLFLVLWPYGVAMCYESKLLLRRWAPVQAAGVDLEKHLPANTLPQGPDTERWEGTSLQKRDLYRGIEKKEWIYMEWYGYGLI